MHDASDLRRLVEARLCYDGRICVNHPGTPDHSVAVTRSNFEDELIIAREAAKAALEALDNEVEKL